MTDRDVLNRFVFEHTHVRGELVHLDATWQAVLSRHHYPPLIRDLLGQAMAAAVLLSTTLKSGASLTLQLSGDGPLSMLVVQASAARTLRGLAHWREPLPEDAHLGRLAGRARLVITLDPGEGKERYQGIVAVEDEASLADALSDYFARSEQLETRLWLAANGERAAGLLLQALPGGSEDADAWPRMRHLGSTLSEAELLDLSHREILHRLFHEEDVRLFEAEPVSFRCSCSRQRIENMLRGLGYDEVQGILADEGAVQVDCEFCNQQYVFDAVDVEQLFAASDQPRVPSTRH
ncbi:Hsp33 family molecular chaperone HslO [Thiohalobacter sp. IOR34]|uniref:Hsp33 family molecular chaperone HslO n=1 Tax=Thiohalobacter sp. IOR34 TaxID=3057176 RepID=UPI0025B15630|nr:Hsp33 family molecular chaperone HslO [Thiohalobacter sp. IOR34]WJW75938.1 Hsp33 family molecular chaperone HslO [Thiohalobacter sp. IOR34]